MIMAKKNNIVKPPAYIFSIHTLFASLSAAIILLINDDSFYIYGYIFALSAFSSGLIFLTVDRNLKSSKNYSLHWTSQISRVLVIGYIFLGAYISWEYGYDLAYERFLNNG